MKIDPDEGLDEQMDSISDVVTRVAWTGSKSESSRTEVSFRDEAQSVRSRIDMVRKTPSATSQLSGHSRVKVVRPPTLKSMESQQGFVQKSDSLKSSDLGAPGCQKACNCTKEDVDPLCKGKYELKIPVK